VGIYYSPITIIYYTTEGAGRKQQGFQKEDYWKLGSMIFPSTATRRRWDFLGFSGVLEALKACVLRSASTVEALVFTGV
jgi:hypothetical protein